MLPLMLCFDLKPSDLIRAPSPGVSVTYGPFQERIKKIKDLILMMTFQRSNRTQKFRRPQKSEQD
jgi:hypothetical protein